MTPMGPFDRLGRFVVRHARLVVAAWAVLIVVALPFAPQAPSALRAGGFIRDDLESARAKALLEQELGSAIGPRCGRPRRGPMAVTRVPHMSSG